MIHNPIQNWPDSFKFSDRKFTQFKARVSKGGSNLIFVLGDSKGNL